MGQSILLDKGLEDMWIYPEVEAVNNRGARIIMPAEGPPLKIRVTTSVDQGSDAELAGQVSIPVLRVITRDARVGAWCRIEYRGEQWDLAYPPRFTPGVTRATRHVEFGIRGRNSSAERGSRA